MSTSGLWASTYGCAHALREFIPPYHKSCCGYDCICDVVTRTQPRTCICSAADRDECKDMIASDEGKARLNHRKTRVSHGQAVFSLPSPFYCNHQEHVDTPFYLLTSNRTRSNALRMCYQSRIFFFFLWFEGYARRVMMHDGILHEERTALLAWRAGRTDCRDWKGGETAGEKSRKDNKGEGVSCQCPLRKSPPSGSRTALLNYTCLFSSSFSYSVQIKLHLFSVSQEEMGPFKASWCSKRCFFFVIPHLRTNTELVNDTWLIWFC